VGKGGDSARENEKVGLLANKVSLAVFHGAGKRAEGRLSFAPRQDCGVDLGDANYVREQGLKGRGERANAAEKDRARNVRGDGGLPPAGARQRNGGGESQGH